MEGCVQYDISSLLYHYNCLKEFNIGYGCDLFIVKGNFNIGVGLVICNKLNVVI